MKRKKKETFSSSSLAKILQLLPCVNNAKKDKIYKWIKLVWLTCSYTVNMI